MAVLAVELTFPAAPITSLQKRIAKGVEQLYYAKLFLSSPTYESGEVWRRWHDMGFHVAIYSPPPGTAPADQIRVRLRAPSRTPLVSVTGSNVDALKDLESSLRAVDDARQRTIGLRDSEVGRTIVAPLVERLTGLGFEAGEIEAYEATLQRGFDALTNHEIQSIDIALT